MGKGETETKITVILSDLYMLCYNYADDFILHSSEIEKHFAYLEKLFQKVIDDGIKLNLKKCNMFIDECDFLGSTIKNGTISLVKRHVEAILKMGQPEDKSELRRFLGCTNYVKHVVPECTPMLQPLYKLLRKNVNYNIAEAESLAIQKLKHCLSNPPVLHAPVANGKFQLYVDGSLKGLGAISYQNVNGELRVIGYASKPVDPNLSHWVSVIELELMALYDGTHGFQMLSLWPHSFSCVYRSSQFAWYI